MFRIITITGFMLTAIAVSGQQKEGRVSYQRVMEVNIQITGNPELAKHIPKSRTNNFELNFRGNIASWKAVEDPQAEEQSGSGLVIRTMGAGDDLTYFDLDQSRKVQQTEFAGKNYLVTDSIRAGKWKLTDESKTILGHLCRKAVATLYSKRMMTIMENGEMKRKEVSDTTSSEAWFTTDIPVSVGPEMQGQLPGLVLELSMRSGKVVYTATEIADKPDNSSLKEPGKGKKISAADFAIERNRVMDQMQRNSGSPGGFRISVGQ